MIAIPRTKVGDLLIFRARSAAEDFNYKVLVERAMQTLASKAAHDYPVALLCLGKQTSCSITTTACLLARFAHLIDARTHREIDPDLIAMQRGRVRDVIPAAIVRRDNEICRCVMNFNARLKTFSLFQDQRGGLAF